MLVFIYNTFLAEFMSMEKTSPAVIEACKSKECIDGESAIVNQAFERDMKKAKEARERLENLWNEVDAFITEDGKKEIDDKVPSEDFDTMMLRLYDEFQLNEREQKHAQDADEYERFKKWLKNNPSKTPFNEA